VLFDASNAVSVDPSTAWAASTTGFDPEYGYEVVTNVPSWTDCGPVDPSVFGSSDIRQWFVGDWGIGFGTSAAMAGDLELAVTGSGQDWAADWAPNVMYTWVYLGASTYEYGYAFAFEETCGVQQIDPTTGAGVMLPAPTSGLSGVIDAQSFFVFGI